MENTQTPIDPTAETPVLTPEEEAHKKEATTSMILGIVGDLLVWYPVVNVAGLVLAIIALVKSNRNRDYALSRGIRENGMNVAGKWCGIGGIVVGAVTFLLYLAAIAFFVLLIVGGINHPEILEQLPAAFPQLD